MDDLKKMSMSELIARYNAVAATKNVASVEEFKNLATARAAVQQLEEGPVMNTETITSADVGTLEPSVLAPEGSAAPAQKYNSSGKRGPNQGVGEYAKAQIIAGKDNKTILEEVLQKFPGAKTTGSCIAYYRAAVKNPNMGKKSGKTAEQLRADAAAILAKAETLEAAAKAKASAEAAATAPPAETQEQPAA